MYNNKSTMFIKGHENSSIAQLGVQDASHMIFTHDKKLSESLPTNGIVNSNLLSLALCLIVFLVFAKILHAVWIRFFHLQTIPGPFWAAYTRLWLCMTLASGDSARIFVDVNKKYGNV